MTFKTLAGILSPASSNASPSPASSSPSCSSPPASPRHRLCLRPPPSPIRRPLPHHWMHPPSTSPTTSSPVSSSPTAFAPESVSVSASNGPVDSDSDLRLLHTLAYHLNGAYRPLSRPRHRVSISAPCSPQFSHQKLVFASGAVSTASALGHVFGRPLQAREAIPCSPGNCAQLHTGLQQSLIQQAQSPSHTFQQQCSLHKRFHLFRQRPRKCPVHTLPSGPNYILPPTTVHPLVVRPDKILLDHYDDPAQMVTWNPILTSSVSESSHLSSYSTVSLSSCAHGSDSDSGSGNTTLAPSKKKKRRQSNKEKEQKQQLRCLCYLDASLDQQHTPLQQKAHSQPLALLSTWYPQKHQKEASRLRRIWNDSTIFHWSKPPGTSRRDQQQQPQEHQPHQPQHPHNNHHHQHHHYHQQQELYQEDTNRHGHTVSASEQNARDQIGVPMRNSLSGTDISDEGNHTLTDLDDDDDNDDNDDDDDDSESSSAIESHRVSFQDHYGSRPRTSRPGDDLKAISRHQAELNQQPGPADYNSYMMALQPQQEIRPFASTFVAEDDDDDDEDWDIQSDSGAPSSSPMYSAEAREPTSFSTVTLPLSPPTKSYLKKPSNANLNSLRGRQRCLSLPADTMPPGFLKMSSTPSEIWDEDFDIDSGEINVPTKVVESQISLQMDIYNIKDFALQIEDLKTLRASLRTASSSLKATNPKRHQDLSMLFQRDWEQAEVIIDLGEIAQTSTSSSNAGPALAAGPLSLLSGKGSQPSISNAGANQSPRGPALSTAGPNFPSSALAQMVVSNLNSETRSESQCSTLTGSTIAASSSGGDSESDASSSTSSRPSSGMTAGVESALKNMAFGQAEKRRPHLGSGIPPLHHSSPMKESCSSPATLGHCSTPATPLPNSLQAMDDNDKESPMAYTDIPVEYEPYSKWQHHTRDDSSATFRAAPIASNSASGGGAGGVQAEIDASFRRYQKYSHHSKRRSSSRRVADDEDEDKDEDGYESYGYGDGSSVGVITPIPSDRHMQVLKDILMEGLGSDVARQYMFKHGEQDHVRFSVEVIPGLLGHLRGLQQRLGDQLMELQQLTVLA